MIPAMSTARTSRNRRAEDDFGYALGVVLRAYHGSVVKVIGELPQGPRGYQTLRAVVRGDHPSQLALATHLGIDRTVMTYLVDELVEADLVERQPDPSDRRRRKVVATTRGTKVCRELEKKVRAAEDALFAGIDRKERDAFRDLLWRVACHVRDIGSTIDPCDVVDEMLGDDLVS